MKPYECVRRFWAENFPDWPVVTADAGGDIFNLGASRNAAVRQAQTDVVFLTDADTIVLPVENIRRSVVDPTGICWPHNMWRLIPPEYADQPPARFPTAPTLLEYEGGLGGCLVATQAEYWRLGGQPEEFTAGWGCEDKAFAAVAETLSTLHRIHGTAHSIEHNTNLRNADSPGWNRDSTHNEAKFKPYRSAHGNPELMRELLKIRNEPLPNGTQDWRTRLGLYDPIRSQLFKQESAPPPPRRPDWRTRAMQG